MSSIGSMRRNATAVLQRFGLDAFREILPSEEFRLVAGQTGSAPKRDRPLIPEVVAWLMMYVGLHTESMTQGLIQACRLVKRSQATPARSPHNRHRVPAQTRP